LDKKGFSDIIGKNQENVGGFFDVQTLFPLIDYYNPISLKKGFL
jgi:hypothetical protein